MSSSTVAVEGRWLTGGRQQRRAPLSPGDSDDGVRWGSRAIVMYVASISVALALCGHPRVRHRRFNTHKVFSALVDGSVRSPGSWGLTLTTATPLLDRRRSARSWRRKGGPVEHRPGGAGLPGRRRHGTAYVATRPRQRRDRAAPHRVVHSSVGRWAAWGHAGGSDEVRPRRGPRGHLDAAPRNSVASQITSFGADQEVAANLAEEEHHGPTTASRWGPRPATCPCFASSATMLSWGALVSADQTHGRRRRGARPDDARLPVADARPQHAHGTSRRRLRRRGSAPRHLAVSGATAGLAAGGLWLTGGAAGDRFTGSDLVGHRVAGPARRAPRT